MRSLVGESRLPYRDELRVGERCDGCGEQLDKIGVASDAPCPWCGSTVRRMPRLKGQAVSDVIDVAEVRA